jgi:uncharacterized Zn finger protein
MKCPICSQEVKEIPHQDDFIYTIKCPICGVYKIEDLASETERVP